MLFKKYVYDVKRPVVDQSENSRFFSIKTFTSSSCGDVYLLLQFLSYVRLWMLNTSR